MASVAASAFEVSPNAARRPGISIAGTSTPSRGSDASACTAATVSASDVVARNPADVRSANPGLQSTSASIASTTGTRASGW